MIGLVTMASCSEKSKINEQQESKITPHYLYKIISIENWKKSQGQASFILTTEDDDFIHFAREDQLQRIIDKYWADAPEYVVLKIETKQLPGKLKFEANPGGTNKYYHLYHGSIPIDSVAESKIVRK